MSIKTPNKGQQMGSEVCASNLRPSVGQIDFLDRGSQEKGGRLSGQPDTMGQCAQEKELEDEILMSSGLLNIQQVLLSTSTQAKHQEQRENFNNGVGPTAHARPIPAPCLESLRTH